MEAEKMQPSLVERWELNRAANFQVAEGEESIQGLQYKMAPATAEMNEWQELLTEAAEEQR